MTVVKPICTLWSTQECTTAAAIYQRIIKERGMGHGVFSIIDREVAQAVGRSISAAAMRRFTQGPTYNADVAARDSVRHDAVPNRVLAERERRREALDLRDLTGRICGDPPRGYSMLDRRQTA